MTDEIPFRAPYHGVTFNNNTVTDNSTGTAYSIPACYLNQHIPDTSEVLEVVMSNPALIFMMMVALLLVFFTVLMYVEGQVYIFKKIPGRRKVHLSFIFSLYPVFSATALCGFYFPKAHIVAKFTSEIWLSVVLFQFVLLVSEYYGNRQKILSVLHGVKVPLAGPPCCCCCCCFLPSVLINAKNVGKFFRRVKILVLQVAVLRPVLWFVAVILWINGNYHEGALRLGDAYPYLTLVALSSNLVALQALVTFFQISQDPLSSYKIRPKFFTVQLVLIATSLQSLVTAVLAKVGVIKCLGPFSPRVNERMILNFTVIVEMFFFMMLAALWYRRVEGNVDHDLIERRTYKRMSKANYNKNPAEQIMLSDYSAPNGGDGDAKRTTPSPAQKCQPDSVWQHRELNGNGSLLSTKSVASDSRRPPNAMKTPLVSDRAPNGRAVTHIRPHSGFALDCFASSRETDV